MTEPQTYYELLNEPSILTKFDGCVLEDVVPGFRTLNVFGREIIGAELAIQKIDGRDGASFVSSSLPTRIITVEYWLKGENDTDFKLKFELLNHYLHKQQGDIIFSDDPNYKWIGILSEVGEVADLINWTTSTFSFLCVDPFKYSIIPKTIESVGNLTFIYSNLYPILPDEIRIVLNGPGTTLNFSNTNTAKNIIINTGFISGDEIVIKPGEQVVTQNGLNILNTLDLTSNLEDFYINKGDTLNSSLSANITLKYRDRRL